MHVFGPTSPSFKSRKRHFDSQLLDERCVREGSGNEPQDFLVQRLTFTTPGALEFQ